MEIKDMSIEEIEERKNSIVAESAEATGEALDNLDKEMDSLNAELEKRKAEERKRVELRNAVANGAGETIETFKEDRKMDEIYALDSVEYRDAWVKNLQGKELTDAERRSNETYTAAGTNAVPTLVANVFFEKMKKLAPMLDEITLMHVAGNLKFVTEGTRNDAAKHTENGAITPAADATAAVTLGAYEFTKIIMISKNAETMAIPEFVEWITDMLAGDIARQLDNYILNDATNGVAAVTYTTGTNQILNTATTGYTYKNIVDLIALLPAAYDAEAKFIANKKVLYGEIANILDGQNRPIFVQDAANGLRGYIMGYPVVVDDYVTTANKALYLGRWKDVVGNLSQGIVVDRDEHSAFRYAGIDYRGYAAFDSKPAKTDGIVRLVSTTA